MDDGPAGHAMTEVALGLAMCFFCLLVLTLVSIRAPASASGGTRRNEILATAPAHAAAQAMAETDRLVVFHAGRFLDAGRRPLDPAAVPVTGRVVLAVDPALPMVDVLAARRRLAGADLVVAPLDAAWLAALAAGDRP